MYSIKVGDHVPLQGRFTVVPELKMDRHARDDYSDQSRYSRDDEDDRRQRRASTTGRLNNHRVLLDYREQKHSSWTSRPSVSHPGLEKSETHGEWW